MLPPDCSWRLIGYDLMGLGCQTRTTVVAEALAAGAPPRFIRIDEFNDASRLGRRGRHGAAQIDQHLESSGGLRPAAQQDRGFQPLLRLGVELMGYEAAVGKAPQQLI